MEDLLVALILGAPMPGHHGERGTASCESGRSLTDAGDGSATSLAGSGAEPVKGVGLLLSNTAAAPGEEASWHPCKNYGKKGEIFL